MNTQKTNNQIEELDAWELELQQLKVAITKILDDTYKQPENIYCTVEEKFQRYQVNFYLNGKDFGQEDFPAEFANNEDYIAEIMEDICYFYTCKLEELATKKTKKRK